ncbi:MAG: lysophospholipid acyltransferase family protein [Bacteroidetes bacterium]|nr:lysophospholipid acyltransferase family protein [Bacteroidota bacterium]MBU1719434.1 lysophospholipid acyltransferase family protein [Bacteroidota bacterium]
MKNFPKHIVIGILFLVSLLPFPLLYCLSSSLTFILRDIAGYRKKVIEENLKRSFPGKSDKERRIIKRKFYRNLTDFLLEIVKIKSMSRKQFAKRVEIQGVDILDEYFEKKKSVLVALGHCPNWEWMAIKLALVSKHKVVAAVKPLTNPYFEKHLGKLRQKFSEDSLIPYKMTLRYLIKNRDKLTITLIAADQTPTRGESDYWTTFLNQDTPVFLGLEKIGKSLDLPVVYLEMTRTKRGYYRARFENLVGNPRDTKEFEITNAHVQRLEKTINEHPDNWFWSHRRWKHKRTPAEIAAQKMG